MAARPPEVGGPRSPGTLTGKVFRTNPDYALTLLDRLPVEERRCAEAALPGEQPYGVMRPRRGVRLPVRTVSPESALLLLSMTKAAELPAYFTSRRHSERSVSEQVLRLVLDGVLQVGQENGFVSGAAGADALRERSLSETPESGSSRSAQLSLQALRYGQELARLDSISTAELALRIYTYGRRPVSHRSRKSFPDSAAMRAWLGLGPGAATLGALDAGWQRVAGTGDNDPWLRWRARIAGTPPGLRPRPRHKLYISPATSHLPDAVSVLAGCGLALAGARAFKVVGDLEGAYRPDKLVLHLEDLDSLTTAAMLLADRMEGLPAHGVPFTAAITGDGLLSWGIDPQATQGYGQGMSWRQWLCLRLAGHLRETTVADPADPQPYRTALHLISLDGIDPATWMPLLLGDKEIRDGTP